MILLSEWVPSDVEDLSDWVKNGKGCCVMLNDEDNWRQNGEEPAEGEADDPADQSSFQGALAFSHFWYFILEFFVIIAVLFIRLIPHYCYL